MTHSKPIRRSLLLDRAALDIRKFSSLRPSLTDQERRLWLRLIRCSGVGPMYFYHILGRCGGDIEQALDEVPLVMAKVNARRPFDLPSVASIDAEYDALLAQGGHWITVWDAEYPMLLRAIDDAPPVLSLKGSKKVLSQGFFAIVGARNASAAGCNIAERIAQDLAPHYAIASGLARGIDRWAHQGALKAMASKSTVAVLASGVDVCYPNENHLIYQAIVEEEGAILSENPLGTQPQSQLFHKRNRLIAALSWGTLIVEAAKGSGSLATAQYALDYGREVFAVPGSPLDPRCQGSNYLLQQGAVLTQSYEDILSGRPSNAFQLHDVWGDDVYRSSDFETRVYSDTMIEKGYHAMKQALSSTPISIEDILRITDLPLPLVRACLLDMELGGVVQRHPGDLYALLVF